MKVLLVLISIVCLMPLKGLAQSNQIIVHDPVAIQVNDKYYVFNTAPGIACWESDDLKNWENISPVFEEAPIWAKEKVPKFNGNIWAPDICFHNNQFYLYYSISSFGSNRSCIGVATNKTLDKSDPDFKWVDHGAVVNSVHGRDNFNAIDPNLIFDENGVAWLSFGSFWGGLKLVKLNDDLISIAEPQEWYNIASREKTTTYGEIEAPFIFKKNGYYYLFASFDFCCKGEESTYNVRVGRSKKVTGPYFDKDSINMNQGGGSYVIGPNDTYYGIGHNSVYTFNDIDYMFSHGYDKKKKGRPILVTHKISWDDNAWPIIK